MGQRDHITVLGGGPAGLATGYYAGKKGISFAIYEARDRIGGNATSFQFGGFRFDAGAHRFQDRDAEVTREVFELLRGELLQLKLTSHIYDHGRMIDFPLSAANLVKTLPPRVLFHAIRDLIRARLRPPAELESFESSVVRMYGRTVAERYLLNYSEKLWGQAGHTLSAEISGSRLKSVSALTFLREVVFGSSAKPAHLEGAFYYPRLGYGMIADRLAERCGPENIHLNSPVRAIHHDGSSMTGITVDGRGDLPVQQLVSTMPLPLFVHLMNPKPPPEYLEIGKRMRFRNLVLVALFIDRPRVTTSGSVYFPGSEFPFTRIHEPINRSPEMAPMGKTSLLVEYSCNPTDQVWTLEKDALIAMTVEHLTETGLIQQAEVTGGEVVRLGNAYPVLELGLEAKLATLFEYLSGFSNLRIIGRNGRFVYTAVHDMLRFGHDVVEDLASQVGAPVVAN